jgi:outer membrane protein
MMKKSALFFLAPAFVASTTAVAQQPPQASEKLRWGLGVGFVTSPRPYVGAKPRTFPVPVVTVRKDRWFVQGIRGGFEMLRSTRWTLSAFAQARFQGLEPEDSEYLDGMEERKKSLDGGVEVVYRGRPVGFRAAALSDTLGRSNGQELSAQLTTGAPLGKKLLVLAGFGPRWETARRVDYYYGVRTGEATSERPPYMGAAALNWDLAVSAIYRPAARWSVFALFNRTRLGEAIRRSPTVERETVSSFVLFVTRDF